jgi:hypothetical protein
MRLGHLRKTSRQILTWLALLGLGVLGGCSAQEDPLSPGAAAFKQEVRQAIDMIAATVADPVAKGDAPAVKAAVSRVMPDSIKLCRACPFMLAVLDDDGAVLALYPPRQKDSTRRYSQYKLISQALKQGKFCHGRFFLQDRSQLYVICAPIFVEGKTVGVIVLTTTEDEVQQRWGISEEEFFAIDFNR